MVNYKDIGIRIRALRRSAGYTQEELAEKVGISASFMGHIERGSRIASLDTFVLLCNVLKTTPNHLLEASLESALEAHMPKNLSAEDRSMLSTFFRLAQDTIDNWTE